MRVRFMTLAGKFAVASEATFADAKVATAAIEAHAASGGYTNVKAVDDGDYGSIRYTARTPGGRGGRNIAFVDYEEAHA
jgi:hypothetical protein